MQQCNALKQAARIRRASVALHAIVFAASAVYNRNAISPHQQKFPRLTSAFGPFLLVSDTPMQRKADACCYQLDRLYGNHILDRLNDDDYRQLAPGLEQIHLCARDFVGQKGAPLTHVYFPRSSVFSVLAFMSDGAAVEVGTIGREGLVGMETLADGDHWTETTICQIEGDALRMPINGFKKILSVDTPLQCMTQRYLLVYLGLVSQSVACNRLHTIEARFARWVLMTHDRLNGNTFHLTQEFLAYMLGVQRPSVSLVAQAFQQAGLIRYSRGRMEILDRDGLEDVSCECYAIVKDQFAQLLNQACHSTH